MLRWTTSTYKSLCAIPEDGACIQVDTPRMALKNEYLLHGMFALSALDIALCGDAVMEKDKGVYVKLALEYYDKASRVFRARLENVTSDNAQSMFMFSFLAVSVNTALAQCEDINLDDGQQSVRGRTVVLWELLSGNTVIAHAHYEALVSGSLSRSAEVVLEKTEQRSKDPISLTESQETALARLVAVAEMGGQPANASIEAQKDAAGRLEAYNAGVAAVRMCMEWESQDVMKGTEIAFPALAGQAFGSALKRSDPVALFIIMHWGALLHTLGKLAWWLGSFGSKMVREVSESYLGGVEEGGVYSMPEWAEGVAWARREAELPPLELETDFQTLGL